LRALPDDDHAVGAEVSAEQVHPMYDRDLDAGPHPGDLGLSLLPLDLAEVEVLGAIDPLNPDDHGGLAGWLGSASLPRLLGYSVLLGLAAGMLVWRVLGRFIP
jgi:hypothetical protein